VRELWFLNKTGWMGMLSASPHFQKINIQRIYINICISTGAFVWSQTNKRTALKYFSIQKIPSQSAGFK
jgi:hypothetical protein